MAETTMPPALRVLLLGASGMIGRAVQRRAECVARLEMLPASHRDRPEHVVVDYESLTTAVAWEEVLRRHHVDAVVNCVGIWSGSAETFERVQYTVPVALFDACSRLGLRVVQVSALGFSADSPLPYAATKARADRYLLAHCPPGVVVHPSLVFGTEGESSRFFLNLAALPVRVDFGFAPNLQPVHVSEVAEAIVGAMCATAPPRTIECAGTHAITIAEYFDALRAGLGLRRAPVRLALPPWCGALLFAAGERLGAHFVNRQSWLLLQTGTRAATENPAARPYERFATPADRRSVRETQLYWFARLGIAFLWLWTAAVTAFGWPRHETLAWLDALWPGLGSPRWLAASCLLDAAMGVASLWRPSPRLWRLQLGLTAVYTAGMALALPWTWSHPLGPLTKNLPVMAAMVFLALHESDRRR